MRYVVLSVNRVAPRGGDYIATHGALGEIRTPGTRFRKPLLFPLSYGGGVQDAGFMQIFSGRYSGISNIIVFLENVCWMRPFVLL